MKSITDYLERLNEASDGMGMREIAETASEMDVSANFRVSVKIDVDWGEKELDGLKQVMADLITDSFSNDEFISTLEAGVERSLRGISTMRAEALIALASAMEDEK